VTIFPGSLACCGFDTGDSVELDITSSDAYGYIQMDRGAAYDPNRYACYVLAWKSPGSGLSLAPTTAPSGGGAWDWYCWTNDQTPVYDLDGYVTGGTDFACSNYASAIMLSTLRFTVSLRKRPPASGYDSRITIRTVGPRIFFKVGASTVSPLSSSDALSSGYIATANGAGWKVLDPQVHSGSAFNTTTHTVTSACACSGRSRSRTISPDTVRVPRPKSGVLPSLTSCNAPIGIEESYAISVIGTLQDSTLTSLPTFNFGMHALEWSLSVDAMRLLIGSATLPLFADVEAGSC
jgi:hypothetical protein